MAIPGYDYWRRGRELAGYGWYKPAPPGWLQILSALSQAAPQAAAAAKGAYTNQQVGSLTDQLNRAGTPNMTGWSYEAGPSAGPPPAVGPTSYEDQLPTSPLQAAQNLAPPEAQAPITPYPGLTPEQQARLQKLRRQQYENQLMQRYFFSSRELKDNIERADEQRSLAEVMRTPVYRYRYRDEPPWTQGRIGPMAEEVPASWQTPDAHGIRMPVMIGAMHAAIRALGRDVQTLKEAVRRG
jgi:hypothetical protein